MLRATLKGLLQAIYKAALRDLHLTLHSSGEDFCDIILVRHVQVIRASDYSNRHILKRNTRKLIVERV